MVDVSEQSEAVPEETTATTAAPAPPAIKLQVEVWAERKGMLPQRAPAAPAHAGSIPLGRPINPQFWRFAAARGFCCWPNGAETTEAEFDAAVEQATNGTVMR